MILHRTLHIALHKDTTRILLDTTLQEGSRRRLVTRHLSAAARAPVVRAGDSKEVLCVYID